MKEYLKIRDENTVIITDPTKIIKLIRDYGLYQQIGKAERNG